MFNTGRNISENISASETYSLEETAASQLRFHLVDDQSVLDRLNHGATVKVYRAMALIDGRLYPPMATKEDRSTLSKPARLGQWVEAEEHPERAKEKNGELYFDLVKDNGDVVPARYNPYIHTSRSPLNDQFSTAYKRPNLVVVETLIPESELHSGYKAKGAKDQVGEMSWHSGPVSSQLAKAGMERKVILTRWAKPTRIVPDREVARLVSHALNRYGIAVPSHTVTPSLRRELVKHGVAVIETVKDGKVMKKSDWPTARKATQAAETARNRGVRL